MTALRPRLLIALDTATHRTTVACGDAAGCRGSLAEDREGRPLLELVETLLDEVGARAADIDGLIVGTGPGSFTGLRIGLAMAKTLAYARRLPLCGVPTVEALAGALVRATVKDEGATLALVMPAGARDRYLARVAVDRRGEARLVEPVALLPPGTDLAAAVAGSVAVAVGLPDDALGAAAAALGARAVEGLGPALLARGAARLARGATDDPATLVPQYVALPRGVTDAAREMSWSPDLR